MNKQKIFQASNLSLRHNMGAGFSYSVDPKPGEEPKPLPEIKPDLDPPIPLIIVEPEQPWPRR